MRLRVYTATLALAALCGCSSTSSDNLPLRSCDSELVFAPAQSLTGTVAIAGEWNGFSLPGQAMTKQPDGTYHLTVSGLEPRDYGYDLVIDGKAQLDPGNPYSRWLGDIEHSLLHVDDCAVPKLSLTSFKADGTGTLSVKAQYLEGNGRAGFDPGATQLTLDGDAIPDALDLKTGVFSIDRTGLSQGKHVVRVAAKDKAGHVAEELYLPFWTESTPYRWGDGAMYFAFTDRFRDGDPENDDALGSVDPKVDYQGGDWAGIAQKINDGYFDALGVRSIWISPVDQNPDDAWAGQNDPQHLYSGYHGYWPSAVRTPQRRFGSLADLQALTKAAHQHGIRVIGDIVINHVHQEHPYWDEHQADGWFNTEHQCICGVTCSYDVLPDRQICWFTSYLPDYNWRNPDMVNAFVSDALFWLEEGDLDGFRVDAVKHVDHVAGRTLAGKLHEITRLTGNPYYLVGETFSGTGDRPLVAQYIGPMELDGQFDFPTYWVVRNVFAHDGQVDPSSNADNPQPYSKLVTGFGALDAALSQNDAFYAPGTLNSPFFGNQDVPRIETAAEVDSSTGKPLAGDANGNFEAWNAPAPPRGTSATAYQKLKFAFAYLLTQPGVPLIYYGDEIGMAGQGDPDNRRMMRFDADLTPLEADLLAYVQKVGQARRANEGLKIGTRHTLLVQDDVYVYERDDLSGSDGAIVAINRLSTPQTLTLGLVGNLASVEGQFHDVLSSATATLHAGAVSLTIAPNSAAIFVP
jgi:glycosidase